MPRDRIRSIAIVGGGAAGWLSAAALARIVKPDFCAVRVIDCAAQSCAAVAESTLPSFHRLNNLLGIDEQDLMRRCGATYKLGTQFRDWQCPGHSYFHTFGSIGAKLDAVSFHHHWLRLGRSGRGGALEDYSVATVASKQGRFAPPVNDRQSVLSRYAYGYHFHSPSFAAYLRGYAEAHGVMRLQRQVVRTRLHAEDGFVEALELEDGSVIHADLYIDCRDAVQRAQQCLFDSPCMDWSHWLPCNRAVALATAGGGTLPPYSQAAAHSGGWQWRVPLQHCLDSGYVYSSQFLSDDEAMARLLKDSPGDSLADARLWRLASGPPVRFWDRNWLTLPGNTLEPLESTGLHLIQTGIMRLLTLFPVHRYSPSDVEEYNRVTTMEYERIRDFLVLHYKATQREDSPLWDYCRHMDIPDTLRAKMELFQDSGRIALLEEEHFGEDSWLSLLLGQGIEPAGYDPLADVLDAEQVSSALACLQSQIQIAVDSLPTHEQFIAERCRMAPMGAV